MLRTLPRAGTAHWLTAFALMATLTACPEEDKNTPPPATGFDFDIQAYNGTTGNVQFDIVRVGGTTTHHTLTGASSIAHITRQGALNDQFSFTATVGTQSGSVTCTVGPQVEPVTGDPATGFASISVFESTGTGVSVDCGTNWVSSSSIPGTRSGSLSPVR